MDFIYHITRRKDWEDSLQSGTPYTISTLGKSLEDVGFIHNSFARQVPLVANRVYRGQEGLVLLKIDPALLKSPVKVEPVAGTTEQFPHIFGPIDREAVISVTDFLPDADGTFTFDGEKA